MLHAQIGYNKTFPPVTATATNFTSAPIPLGSSYILGNIQISGTALTTVTFAVQASNDGIIYTPLNLWPVLTPTSISATITATTAGIYQTNLSNWTYVRIVTSGTFTATNVTFSLTGSPNAQLARSTSGSSGGATFPSTPAVVCNTSTTASTPCQPSNITSTLGYTPASTAGTLAQFASGGAINPDSIAIGANPPTACGGALNCQAYYVGDCSTAVPTLGQSFLCSDSATNSFLVSVNGAAPMSLRVYTAPVLTVLAAGTSGTFNVATNTTSMYVVFVGCGGGGAGTGTGSGNGSNCGGANTTFGPLTATYGAGGVSFFGASAAPGTATGGTFNYSGNAGNPTLPLVTTQNGSNGAASCLGAGSAPGGFAQSDTGDATGADASVPGSGGGGAAVNGIGAGAGPGGASGGCGEWYNNTPAASYSYSVAGIAPGGVAGTGGAPGGDGAGGIVYVWEYKN